MEHVRVEHEGLDMVDDGQVLASLLDDLWLESSDAGSQPGGVSFTTLNMER